MHIEFPHGCGRTHGGHQSLAECTWPDAAYVVGDGPFAVLARCDIFTVTLYETSDEARRRKQALDANGCGKTCEGAHELAGLAGAEALLGPVPVVQSATDWLRS